MSQNYYSLFTNRKQKFGEELASFGAELERLARLAYPECSFAVRDKIACAQFLSALSDGFLRQTLQLEGITSLKLAVERAKAVKIIREENFERKRDGYGKFSGRNFEQKNFEKGERKDARKAGDAKVAEGEGKGGNGQKGKWRGNNFGINSRECWTCGKTGHFRAECPNEKGNAV